MRRVERLVPAPPRQSKTDNPDLVELEKYADILMPTEAEEPILAPGPRAALFEWMKEIGAAAELASVGLKARRTALLYGPPGTGKTTWAHHFAARLGRPLAAVRSESLVTPYIGESGRNIAALFDAMKQPQTPAPKRAVIFFDEIDSIGSKRQGDSGASTERSSTLNVLLRRIERIDGIVLAATNRQDILDPALWRRFDMQVSIDLPGHDERFAIIRRYAAPFAPPDDDVDLLAGWTHGASPALLRALIEGVKRASVIGPKVGRAIDDAPSAFRPVLAAVSAPPELAPPDLWGPTGHTALGALSWPWPRSSEAAA